MRRFHNQSQFDGIVWLQQLMKHKNELTMENIVKKYVLVCFICHRRSFTICDVFHNKFPIYYANLDLFEFLTLKQGRLLLELNTTWLNYLTISGFHSAGEEEIWWEAERHKMNESRVRGADTNKEM